jgi:lipid-A-disaccharide synthase
MSRNAATTQTPKRLFVVSGEHSGDALGGKLIGALRALGGDGITCVGGVGDAHMRAEGVPSLYPLSDVAVMGPIAILKALPRIRARVLETVEAIVAAKPDALVIIDSPEFTHPIAKRVRKRLPGLPIVDYVSPSVWAWRPGRAKRMRAYVDHVLALLPFEPAAHQRLGGPACTYVGHPLVERLSWMRGLDPAPLKTRLGISENEQVLVVLPGSRASEVTRLMAPFGAAVDRLAEQGIRPRVVIPVVKSVRHLVEQGLAGWRTKAHLVEGEEDKFRAFRMARAALAASGTVTLELALAGTPMVVAYRIDWIAARLRFLLKVHSVVLANLVLGENAFPELIQEDCTPEKLSQAVAAILRDGTARDAQLAALKRIPDIMERGIASPSKAAAEVVMEILGAPR